MPTDTNVDNLIINVLTEEQYEEIQNPSSTELYLVPDVIDDTPTEDSPNPVSSGGVYDAINNATIDSDIFSCTFTLTSGVTGTIDKTASEILQAANANKSVLCIYGNEIYFLVSKNVLTFSRIIGNACKYISYNQPDDNWMIITTNLQTSLVSGTTIKTINDESLLGSGNIDTTEILWCAFDSSNNTMSGLTVEQIIVAKNNSKEVCCTSGIGIYRCTTADNNVIVFSSVTGGVASSSTITTINRPCVDYIVYYSGNQKWGIVSFDLQRKLVGSGTGQNIKTINNENLLGSGNIFIGLEYNTTTNETASTSNEVITFTGIRKCQVLNFDSATVSGTLDITIEADGYGENQILLNNGVGGNVIVTFSAVVLNNTSLSGSNIYVPSNQIEVQDGKSMLVNILCYHTSTGDKAVITVIDSLEPLA